MVFQKQWSFLTEKYFIYEKFSLLGIGNRDYSDMFQMRTF